MRRGFSLITAIIILVAVATLLVLMLSLSSQTAKQTGDIYLKEQVDLLAKSATEYALLAISGHDNSHNCIERINMTYPGYEINMSLNYIGTDLNCTADHELADDIATAESNGTVIIDTIITTKATLTSEPIRFHRRTIQKP